MKVRSKIKNHKGKEVSLISSFTQSQKELMTNMYLSSVVCNLEDIEKKSTMGFIHLYLTSEAILNNHIYPIIHNSELDKVDIAVDLMHCVSEIVNDPDFMNSVGEARDDLYMDKLPFADKTTRVKGIRMYTIGISRAVVFSFYIENWRIDISYKFKIELSEDNLKELYDKHNIDSDNTVPLSELTHFRHEIDPIDKFTVSVRECDSEINSKQINVMKNINISNRVIITHL